LQAYKTRSFGDLARKNLEAYRIGRSEP
jgi:hypothetical protein